MRLSAVTAASLPDGIARPGYDRAAQAVGIVHLGIGAFHRAHQAWYTDAAMNAGDRDWTITGVSLRSPGVAEQLNPQDGLYTVTERSAGGSATRLVGAVQGVLVAAQDPAGAINLIAAPATHIVSLTVTEKGYGRAADGSLDPALTSAGGIYGLIGAALAQRRAAGLPGLTLLSCDNLADNGAQLARLMAEYLEQRDAALARWFAAECTAPATMVDRIVPATTGADRADVAARLGGLHDAGAVVTEGFSQWVIEDRFAGPRPRWQNHGALLVSDVAPYELAKLRMLNGAHSALAHIGLSRGHDYVHQAMADPFIRPAIASLMRDEAAPTLTAAPGQNLDAYADELMARFDNPALNHRLRQIAMDSSQKLPQRWLATLAWHQRHGRQAPVLLSAVGAWLRHLRGENGPVDDPRAAEFTALWAAHGVDAIVPAMFGPDAAMACEWRPTAADQATIRTIIASE